MKRLNLQHIKAVLIEYPMVILAAILAYIHVFCEIESHSVDPDSLFIIFSSAIPIFFGLKMMSQRIGKVWLLRLIGILLLVVYYYILPASVDDFTDVTALIIIPIYILLHLFVAVAKDLPRSNNQTDFWRYNKNIFINIITSLVFSGVLVAGILSVVYTCDSLFELDFNHDFYFEITLLILIVGNTFIFLLFDYKTKLENETKDKFPVVLKFFTQYVLIPIMFLYTIVLYLYSIKILISWELPQGWLSYGILSYSIVGILALLLVYPLREETNKSWVKWFYKLFFYSLIPLIVLLYIAIFTRLLNYGFTEPRYYVLALAVWLTLCTLYNLLSKKARISFIPKSLMLTIIVALIFPYINTFAVSVRSQQKEVKKLINEINLIKNGKIDYNTAVTYQELNDINNKIRYLNQRDAAAEFLQQLGLDKNEYADKAASYDLLNPSHFNNIVSSDSNEELQAKVPYQNISFNNELIQVNHKTFIWKTSGYNSSPISLNQDSIQIFNDKNELKIVVNHAEQFDFFPLAKKYMEERQHNINEERDVEEDVEKYFMHSIGKYKFHIYPNVMNQFTQGDIYCSIDYIIIEVIE